VGSVLLLESGEREAMQHGVLLLLHQQRFKLLQHLAFERVGLGWLW
jgi:hypothetical protein